MSDQGMDNAASMGATNRGSYWAAADADKIGSELNDRRERYYRFLRGSGQLEIWRTAVEKWFSGANDLGKVRIDGSDDEQLRMSVNHTRNVGQILLNNITQQKITFQPKATNTDSRSQTQTILSKGILEYIFKDQHIDTMAREVVDMTLAMGEGGVHVYWDEMAGDEYDYDEATGKRTFTGGIKFDILNPLDIIRDYTSVTTRDPQWTMIRKWRNKYDLAAKYGGSDQEAYDAICAVPGRNPTDPYSPLVNWFGLWNFTPSDADEVAVYEFYHLPSPSMPQGRHTTFIDASIVLEDGPMELKSIPVFRTFGGVHFGRNFGYSSMFDCFSVQSGIDALYSSIATNNSLAIQNIMIPNGAGIKINRSRGGMNIIKYDPKVGKPEALQLVQTAPETYNFLRILETDIEKLSGVNSVARGQPEASLKSGAALALVQSQTIQFAQGLNASYTEFLDDLASMVIELYQKNADLEQTAVIVGRANRSFVKQFVKGDLDRIVRVSVDLGSPMANSLSGRVQMAQDLLQYKGITPEQYLMVVETGRLENMTEGPTAELLNIRSENERLADGKPAQALIFDNHPLHIKEHHSLVASPEARENPEMVQATLAHVQEHLQLWFNADPNVLMALGIPAAPQPPPPPPPPPPAPIPAMPGTAESALADIANNIMVEPKDRIAAAQALLKVGDNLVVPAPRPAGGVQTMPPPLPPGQKGSQPSDVLKGPEGLPGGEFVRMPSMPKDALTGERHGPVSSVAPPGVAAPLHP
jgi:hypothetical protein